MSNLRDQFEEKYKQMYSTDECILMQNGNYSGWFKQACWDMWQAQHIENQSRIDELEKQLSMMKYINDEQAAIIQGHLDARIGLQNKVDELSHWNNNQCELIKRNELHAQGLKKLLQNLIDDCHTTMRPSVAYEIQKALQGDL